MPPDPASSPAVDMQPSSRPSRPLSSRASLIRRYKWDILTPAERTAVSDALGLAATRASVGVAAVLTTTAIITTARRGKPPLPAYARFLGPTFFSFVAAYLGVLSGGPLYARRILALPDSRLAEDLRVVIGDWQARVPTTPHYELSEVAPNEPPPGLGEPPKRIPIEERLAKSRAREGTPEAKEERKSFTYWLGLTKS